MSLDSMASTYLRWLVERGWTMRFNARCLALLAAVNQSSERYGRIGDDHLQQRMEFAVMRMDSLLAELLEVREDAFDSGDNCGFAQHLNRIGSQVDLDVQSIFHQTKVSRRACRKAARFRG